MWWICCKFCYIESSWNEELLKGGWGESSQNPSTVGTHFRVTAGEGRRAEDEGTQQVSGRAGLKLRSVCSEICVCERVGGQV